MNHKDHSHQSERFRHSCNASVETILPQGRHMIQETGDSTQQKGNGKPQKSGRKKIQADRCVSGLESKGRGSDGCRRDNSKKKEETKLIEHY